MLSVYACIMNDSLIMEYSVEHIRQHSDEIKKARTRMRRQNGLEASPVLVVKSVKDKHGC